MITREQALTYLRREDHRPVFVYLSEQSPEGDRDIIKKGGIPWKPGSNAEPLIFTGEFKAKYVRCRKERA